MLRRSTRGSKRSHSEAVEDKKESLPKKVKISKSVKKTSDSPFDSKRVTRKADPKNKSVSCEDVKQLPKAREMAAVVVIEPFVRETRSNKSSRHAKKQTLESDNEKEIIKKNETKALRKKMVNNAELKDKVKVETNRKKTLTITKSRSLSSRISQKVEKLQTRVSRRLSRSPKKDYARMQTYGTEVANTSIVKRFSQNKDKKSKKLLQSKARPKRVIKSRESRIVSPQQSKRTKKNIKRQLPKSRNNSSILKSTTTSKRRSVPVRQNRRQSIKSVRRNVKKQNGIGYSEADVQLATNMKLVVRLEKLEDSEECIPFDIKNNDDVTEIESKGDDPLAMNKSDDPSASIIGANNNAKSNVTKEIKSSVTDIEKDDSDEKAIEIDNAGDKVREKDDTGDESSGKDNPGDRTSEKDDSGDKTSEKDDSGDKTSEKDDTGDKAREMDDVVKATENDEPIGIANSKDDPDDKTSEKDNTGDKACDMDDVSKASENDEASGIANSKDDVGNETNEKDDVGNETNEKDDSGNEASEMDDDGDKTGETDDVIENGDNTSKEFLFNLDVKEWGKNQNSDKDEEMNEALKLETNKDLTKPEILATVISKEEIKKSKRVEEKNENSGLHDYVKFKKTSGKEDSELHKSSFRGIDVDGLETESEIPSESVEDIVAKIHGSGSELLDNGKSCETHVNKNKKMKETATEVELQITYSKCHVELDSKEEKQLKTIAIKSEQLTSLKTIEETSDCSNEIEIYNPALNASISRRYVLNPNVNENNVSFSIVSYNINDLNHQDLINEILLLSPSIICLQNVNESCFKNSLECGLRIHNYNGVFTVVSNGKNGLAMFYHTLQFELIQNNGYVVNNLLNKEIQDMAMSNLEKEELLSFLKSEFDQANIIKLKSKVNDRNLAVCSVNLASANELIIGIQASTILSEVLRGNDKDYIICGTFYLEEDSYLHQFLKGGSMNDEDMEEVKKKFPGDNVTKTVLLRSLLENLQRNCKDLKSSYSTILGHELRFPQNDRRKVKNSIWFSNNGLQIRSVLDAAAKTPLPDYISETHISLKSEFQFI